MKHYNSEWAVQDRVSRNAALLSYASFRGRVLLDSGHNFVTVTATRHMSFPPTNVANRGSFRSP